MTDPLDTPTYTTSELAAHLGVTPHWMQSKLRTWPITVEELKPVGTGHQRLWTARDLVAASAIHTLSRAIQLPVTRGGVYRDFSEHIHDPATPLPEGDPFTSFTIAYGETSVQVIADVPDPPATTKGTPND